MAKTNDRKMPGFGEHAWRIELLGPDVFVVIFTEVSTIAKLRETETESVVAQIRRSHVEQEWRYGWHFSVAAVEGEPGTGDGRKMVRMSPGEFELARKADWCPAKLIGSKGRAKTLGEKIVSNLALIDAIAVRTAGLRGADPPEQPTLATSSGVVKLERGDPS